MDAHTLLLIVAAVLLIHIAVCWSVSMYADAKGYHWFATFCATLLVTPGIVLLCVIFVGRRSPASHYDRGLQRVADSLPLR